MNWALVKYTCLMRLKKITKGDIAFDLLLFLIGLSFCHGGSSAVQSVLGLASSPMLLLLFCWRFAADPESRGHEYQALLFTRPIMRASYVVSKSFASAIGAQFLSFKMIVLMLLAETLMQVKPFVIPTGWDIANVIVNSLSFGCLAVMIQRVPSHWANVAYALLFYMYIGNSTIPAGMKLTGDAASMSGCVETTRATLCALFCPAINLETIFETTAFTPAPMFAWLSNIFLYLTVATVMLNRREFSYAQD